MPEGITPRLIQSTISITLATHHMASTISLSSDFTEHRCFPLAQVSAVQDFVILMAEDIECFSKASDCIFRDRNNIVRRAVLNELSLLNSFQKRFTCLYQQPNRQTTMREVSVEALS